MSVFLLPARHGITDLGVKERSEVSRNMTEEKVKFTSDYKTRHLLQHTSEGDRATPGKVVLEKGYKNRVHRNERN